jgi:hypothetical protein
MATTKKSKSGEDKMAITNESETIMEKLDGQLSDQADGQLGQTEKMFGNGVVENLRPATVITDIKVLIDQNEAKAKDSCPAGYTLIDEDLNKGAGGAYIFLCVKYGTVSVLDDTTRK